VLSLTSSCAWNTWFNPFSFSLSNDDASAAVEQKPEKAAYPALEMRENSAHFV
jgi:hypothetical protein